ncbi:hypothetical protein DEO72_LG2g1562 [Vigna unguiculata]|uniref:Uncharacterized protein n=1 Tax=Vigna unguiculata TaxID=3917 RepID=A0A4D6KYA3_VIGUN|nr:hypothetical protein DEO72_LG2g1562 [Vigna unguiculata]
MALISIILLCLKTILKNRQHCQGGRVLKNARGSALSANPAVPSVEKCEKNEVERQPSGTPALGPLQVWNKILMLRLSVGI